MKIALYPIPFLIAAVLWLIWAEFRQRPRQVYITKPLSTSFGPTWGR